MYVKTNTDAWYTWLKHSHVAHDSMKGLLSWDSILQAYGMWLLAKLFIRANQIYFFIAKSLKKSCMKMR